VDDYDGSIGAMMRMTNELLIDVCVVCCCVFGVSYRI